MPKLVLAVLVFTMPAIALAQAEQGARGGKWEFSNTFTETSFSYGVGAGVRHQFSNDVFIKAGINIWDYDSLGMLEDPTMVGGRIEFGWLF